MCADRKCANKSEKALEREKQLNIIQAYCLLPDKQRGVIHLQHDET